MEVINVWERCNNNDCCSFIILKSDKNTYEVEIDYHQTGGRIDEYEIAYIKVCIDGDCDKTDEDGQFNIVYPREVKGDAVLQRVMEFAEQYFLNMHS